MRCFARPRRDFLPSLFWVKEDSILSRDEEPDTCSECSLYQNGWRGAELELKPDFAIFILNPRKQEKDNGKEKESRTVQHSIRICKTRSCFLFAKALSLYSWCSVYSEFHHMQGNNFSRMGSENSSNLFPYWPLYSTKQEILQVALVDVQWLLNEKMNELTNGARST